MATIGTFTQTENGFTGEIATLTIQAKKVAIVPESRGGENAPTHRIFLGKAGQHLLNIALSMLKARIGRRA